MVVSCVLYAELELLSGLGPYALDEPVVGITAISRYTNLGT